MSDEFCQNLKDFGKFYAKQNSPALQSAKLFLSYQHQIGHIDGTDNSGQALEDSFEEFRRVWVGVSGKIASYWKFKVVSQLSNDRNAYPGDYRQWGHETFRAANIAFDADSISWPDYDVSALQEEEVNIVIQINGKKRAIINVKKDISENDILKIAKENKIVDKYLNNKLVKNIIFVQNRLINILTDE